MASREDERAPLGLVFAGTAFANRRRAEHGGKR